VGKKSVKGGDGRLSQWGGILQEKKEPSSVFTVMGKGWGGRWWFSEGEKKSGDLWAGSRCLGDRGNSVRGLGGEEKKSSGKGEGDGRGVF